MSGYTYFTSRPAKYIQVDVKFAALVRELRNNPCVLGSVLAKMIEKLESDVHPKQVADDYAEGQKRASH